MSKELETFIAEKVRHGGYANADEVAGQALRDLKAKDDPAAMDSQELAGIRSWRVEPPYQRHLIFYRFDEELLMAERVIHGGRDLPRRLLQSPHEDT